MTWRSDKGVYIKQILRIFIVAVLLNYLWEVAQAPLYVGFEDWRSVWWHCFVAALGDGILIWVILVVGWTIFRRFDWYFVPGSSALSVMLITGLCIDISVEWVAITFLSRWTYTENMPLLPGFNVGLVPVLQMLLLPALIFRIAGRCTEKIL